MDDEHLYENISLQKIVIEDVKIGLRQIGAGPDLVFIHGFPTHGYTWRKILPALSGHFRCHILDMPGLGDSGWSSHTRFDTKSQAKYTARLMQKLGVGEYSIIAHNSGATIARYLAYLEQEKVRNLIMLNTEIPNHRPAWIPFFQKTALIPPMPHILRLLLTQKWYIKSSMGFRQFYSDKTMFDDESNIRPYIVDPINSHRKAVAMLKYLQGIDWKVIDDFQDLHGEIKARALFLWGEDDRTFPMNIALRMVDQFNSEISFAPISNASLLPHEEKPDEVAIAVIEFMGNARNSGKQIISAHSPHQL